MLDSAAFVNKTPTGETEVRARAADLAPKTRRLLIMLDGSRDVAELERVFAPLGDVRAMLLDLAERGLIVIGDTDVAAAQGSAVPAATPARDADIVKPRDVPDPASAAAPPSPPLLQPEHELGAWFRQPWSEPAALAASPQPDLPQPDLPQPNLPRPDLSQPAVSKPTSPLPPQRVPEPAFQSPVMAPRTFAPPERRAPVAPPPAAERYEAPRYASDPVDARLSWSSAGLDMSQAPAPSPRASPMASLALDNVAQFPGGNPFIAPVVEPASLAAVDTELAEIKGQLRAFLAGILGSDEALVDTKIEAVGNREQLRVFLVGCERMLTAYGGVKVVRKFRARFDPHF